MASQSTMLYVDAPDLMLKKADASNRNKLSPDRCYTYIRSCTYNHQNTLAETLCVRCL
jgi:hypothetical protein